MQMRRLGPVLAIASLFFLILLAIEQMFVYGGGMVDGAAGTGRRCNLTTVEAVIGAWCDQVDPALLTGAQAAEASERLAVLGRRLAAKQAQMAQRAADCNAYTGRARSPEEWLAKQNGTSRAEAKRTLDTMKRMKSCPTAAEAFDQGDLSLAEADAVSSAAVLDPSAEKTLVAKATGSHDLAEVRDAADKVKRAARSGEDAVARRARLRAGRRWREFTTADGHRGVDALFVPEDLASVMPIINAFTEAQFEAGRRAGVRDSHEAYRADAVLAAFAAAGASIGLTPTPSPTPSPTGAGGPFDGGATVKPSPGTPAGADPTADPTDAPTLPLTLPDPATPAGPLVPPAKGRGKIDWSMVVLVDGIALKRGYAAPGETCEIPGIGPVSAEWARTLLEDATVDVLVHDCVDIRAYASATRHKPRPLQLALLARDRTCIIPTCRKQGHLEMHHLDPFATGGPTVVTNGCLGCNDHHDDITYRGARLELTDTEILWWPPPPAPGTPPPPEGSVPWRAPRGEHLNPWNLDHLPGDDRPDACPDADSGNRYDPPADPPGNQLPLG